MQDAATKAPRFLPRTCTSIGEVLWKLEMAKISIGFKLVYFIVPTECSSSNALKSDRLNPMYQEWEPRNSHSDPRLRFRRVCGNLPMALRSASLTFAATFHSWRSGSKAELANSNLRLMTSSGTARWFEKPDQGIKPRDRLATEYASDAKSWSTRGFHSFLWPKSSSWA